MNQQTTIIVNGHEVVIKKIPLGRYPDLLTVIKEIPKHLAGLDNFSTDEVLLRLPNIVAEALPELADVIGIATGIPKNDILEEYGLDDLTEVVAALFEVNNVDKIVANIKKMMTRQAIISPKPFKVPKPFTVPKTV